MIIDLVLFALFVVGGLRYFIMNGSVIRKWYTKKEKSYTLIATIASLVGCILSLTLLVGKPTVNVRNLKSTINNRYAIGNIDIEADPNIIIIREKTNYPYTLLRDKTIYKIMYLGKVTRDWT